MYFCKVTALKKFTKLPQKQYCIPCRNQAHLICSTNKMIGFCIECNTGIIWINNYFVKHMSLYQLAKIANLPKNFRKN